MNPFDALKPITKSVKIDGLDSEIELRELTLEEIMRISENEDSTEAMYLYVSTSLVSPKMSVKDLKQLGSKATPVIKQILEHSMPKSGNLPMSGDLNIS